MSQSLQLVLRKRKVIIGLSVPLMSTRNFTSCALFYDKCSCFSSNFNTNCLN